MCNISFVFPIEGDCINGNDGRQIDGGIAFIASVCAPDGADVYINGRKAELSDGLYRAEIEIRGYKRKTFE